MSLDNWDDKYRICLAAMMNDYSSLNNYSYVIFGR